MNFRAQLSPVAFERDVPRGGHIASEGKPIVAEIGGNRGFKEVDAMGMSLFVWLLGISASILSFAYLIILAFLFAAKRRMASAAVTPTRTTKLSRIPEMRYRTP
jgi:hypothetical protein